LFLDYFEIIAKVGEDYHEKYLAPISRNKQLEDWWEALLFLLDRIYYQGRRDDISEKVERRVIKVLSKSFKDGKIMDIEFNQLKDNNWKGIRRELENRIGKGRIGKKQDVDMTIEVLDFIASIEDRNITNYCIRRIQNGEIRDLSEELRKIRGIGPQNILALPQRLMFTIRTRRIP